jgi:hypothetical protein
MNSSRGSGGRFALYAACYAAWFALSALAFWTTLQALLAVSLALTSFRVNVLGIPPTNTVGAGAQLRGLNQFFTLLLVLLWLGGVVFLEGYLRDSAGAGRLWSRAARVAVGLLVALALAYVVQAIL